MRNVFFPLHLCKSEQSLKQR